VRDRTSSDLARLCLDRLEVFWITNAPNSSGWARAIVRHRLGGHRLTPPRERELIEAELEGPGQDRVQLAVLAPALPNELDPVESQQTTRLPESRWAYGLTPNRISTNSELLGWIKSWRARAVEALDTLSNEIAFRPLRNTHRRAGTLLGVTVGSLPLHALEHADQIRQFR
jgi:hypothetical protein